MIGLKTIFAIAGMFCFCLDAFHAGVVSWTPLGFAFITAAVFLV